MNFQISKTERNRRNMSIMTLTRSWRQMPAATWLFLYISPLHRLAISDLAIASFVVREGEFNTSHGAPGTSNHYIYCSYPSEALNFLFMPSIPQGGPQDWQIGHKSGQCLHATPVQLLDDDNFTVTSFSTTFTFELVSQNSVGESIDGLAFIIVPSLAPQGHGDSGYLGLLNATTNNQQSSHTFAVEFDSFPNSEFNDSPQDHVGIDINSMTSINSSRAGYYYDKCPGDDPFNAMVLKDASTIQAWITYNSSSQHVSITVSPYPGFKPDTPLLDMKVNLSGIIQEKMYIGFSSSTGAAGGYSSVSAWSFSVNGTADPIYPYRFPPTIKCPASRKSSLAFILGISIPLSVVIIVILAVLGGSYLRREKGNQGQFDDLTELERVDYVPRKYSYKELFTATEGFSSNHVLGSEGFGSVYKGSLPSRSSQIPMVIAVKRISLMSSQGAQERLAEVKIIGRLRHRCLVQLLGWCHRKDELLLVYEFMINGSLDQWLFQTKRNNSNPDMASVSLEQRFRILSGVASALVHLHEELKQVLVHRNVKASNVMVDSEFNAKLGDFGVGGSREHMLDFHSTNLGSMAPESVTEGIFSHKSDVFSFGVLVLEVISGRLPVDIKRPSEEIVLLTWVWDLYEQGKILDAVDEALNAGSINPLDDMSRERLAAVLHIGLLCCHPDPDLRPPMTNVLQMLRAEAPLLPIASFPHQSRSRTGYLSFSFSDRYKWNEHSVELGMIENSDEIKLLPQFRDSKERSLSSTH